MHVRYMHQRLCNWCLEFSTYNSLQITISSQTFALIIKLIAGINELAKDQLLYKLGITKVKALERDSPLQPFLTL